MIKCIYNVTMPSGMPTAQVSFGGELTSLSSIDWGDGTINTYTSHHYNAAGTYEIKISGTPYVGYGNFTQSTGYSSLQSIELKDQLGIEAMSISGATGWTLTVKDTTPPTLASNAFVSNPAAIYVPSSAVNTYKEATTWVNYASIIQAIPEGTKKVCTTSTGKALVSSDGKILVK